MRIIIPVLGFGRSGGERVLSKLASGLVLKGHEVIFVVPDGRDEIYYPTSAKVIKSRVMKKKIRYISFVVNYIYLYKKCRDLGAEVSVASYHLTSFLTVFLQRKVKKFYYIQANEVKFSEKLIPKLIAQFSYILPLKKIVNSGNLLPSIINNYVSIVPAGIDLNLFSSVEQEKYSRLKIGIVGRKEPFKGTREIIKVIDDFCNLHDVELDLNVAIFLPDINEINLKSIHHYEIGSDNDLADFYRVNDVVIATGLIEDGAFHYPCAEAMASGCIVISNYSPLVDTDSQFKIDSFSKDIIISKLEMVLNLSDKEKYREIENNKKEIQKYGWAIVVDKFETALISD